MKSIKILAPIKNLDDIKLFEDSKCNSVYIYHSFFIENGFSLLDDFINEAQKYNLELYINFKRNIKENDVEAVTEFIDYLISSKITGIMINSYSVLEIVKSKRLPFKIIIDSSLNIHNLAGIDFVNQFHKVENINVTEEIYLKNITKLKKYSSYKLSIDSDNLPWIAEEIIKSKSIDMIIIKGVFKTQKALMEGVQLIENIIDKPKIFKNQKLPFKGNRENFYETNHFSGELLNAEGRDFKFSRNIRRFDWTYKRTRLKKPYQFDIKKIPRINLRLTSFEHISYLKKFLKNLEFNPVYSIEYGEILNTADLAKGSFNMILEKIKEFCHENDIKLQLSTPRVLIERDFDRVYEYVKQLFINPPYPSSIIINNIGYWWTLINDSDFERIPIELGQGLNLSSSLSIKCLMNQHKISAVDLSTIKDIKDMEACIQKIKSHIPTIKLTVGGSIRVPSSGLCPLNSDSAILSRLSCKAPCHHGSYALFNPSEKKLMPVAVDGFCRMHLYKEKVLDLFRYIKYFQEIGINEFVIDFNSLDAKLIPVLLTRFLNALQTDNYVTDPNFTEDEYKIVEYYK